jgi:hypothetical protein
VGLTRRQLLAASGLGVVASAVGARLVGSDAMANTDGQTPRLQWVPVGSGPIATIASSNEHEAELLHPTLLPVRALTGSATAPTWMLWAWHHDTNNIDPHFHAWSTDDIEGGAFTAAPPIPRPDGDYVAAAGINRTYSWGHFSSGDIVWDAAGGRLVSTPHSVATSRPSTLAETPQDSFMMQSTDGLTWTWLDGSPVARLSCGGVGDLDSNHTGYGRLLRDLDGQAQQVGGRYWWIYRGGHHLTSSEISYCTPLLASATYLGGPWTKVGKAFDTAYEDATLLGFDSFLVTAKTPGVFYSTASPAFAPIVTSYAQSTTAGAMAFADPGVPLVLPSVPDTPSVQPAIVPGQVFPAGVSVVRDPRTHQQYLVQVLNNARYTVNTTVTPPAAVPHVTSSEVWLFKAVVA